MHFYQFLMIGLALQRCRCLGARILKQELQDIRNEDIKYYLKKNTNGGYNERKLFILNQ